VNEWIRRRGSFTDGGSINLGSSEVRVHWLSSDMDIRNLTLVDSSYLHIRQKYGGQSPTPQGVDVIESYDDFTEGERVICTFGRRDDEEDKFDFVYRTVISEINPTKYSSFVVNIPDSIELTE